MAELSESHPAGPHTGGSTDSSNADADPVVVVTDNRSSAQTHREQQKDDAPDVTAMVEQPAKVMRIGTMIKQLLEEVRGAPLDDAARARLAQIHDRSLSELEEGLSPELIAELDRLTEPFAADATPTDAELRVAQAQLVGWLEGLFHGIQTALVAQQMAAQAQLSQMRKALPPGAQGGPTIMMPPGMAPGASGEEPHGTGQYL